jgi:membrane dipeptidase
MNSSTSREAAMRIHSESFVIDAHSDIPMADVYPRRAEGERKVMQRVHIPRHREGGVHGAIATVHGDWAKWDTYFEGATKQALEIISDTYSEVDESEGKFVVARTGTEMEQARAKGSFSVLLGLEGAKGLEGSLGVLRSLHRLGVRSISLTHNVRNHLADGAGVRESGGLTDLGRQAIEEINALPMVLDLAHISERCFYEAIELAKNVPIISHTGCRDLYPFRVARVPWRNATDKQIRAVADRKGVVGIAAISYFLTDKPATVDDCVRHVEHVIRLVGIDHVGMGFDFMDYGTPVRMAWLGESGAERWDRTVADLKVAGLEDVTKVPNLTEALIEKGYSDGEIGKILGGNFLRVFKAVLG